jgi:hypothetical protein
MTPEQLTPHLSIDGLLSPDDLKAGLLPVVAQLEPTSTPPTR